MSGEIDPLYVRARTALLDAADALQEHLDAVVLVGAQAVYLHTGAADLVTAEYTTDADFTIRPEELSDSPLLVEALESHGFSSREDPGAWLSPDGIFVDIMVPEALAGPGRRGANLGVHGRRAARRAKGLEGALVDFERMEIHSLDAADRRSVQMSVAGPGALLVAKVHKINERADIADRLSDKDALDVLRLLRAVPVDVFVERLHGLMTNEVSGDVVREAVELLVPLFGGREAAGVRMAVRAAGPGEDADTIAGSLVVLIEELSTQLPSAQF